MVFELEILPISANRFYETNQRHLVPSKAGLEFIKWAKAKIIYQIREQALQQELMTLNRATPLRLRLDFHSPDWIANDQIAVRSLDNLPRAVQEALTAAIKTYNPEYNDCSIVETTTRKKNSDKTQTIIVLEKC